MTDNEMWCVVFTFIRNVADAMERIEVELDRTLSALGRCSVTNDEPPLSPPPAEEYAATFTMPVDGPLFSERKE